MPRYTSTLKPLWLAAPWGRWRSVSYVCVCVLDVLVCNSRGSLKPPGPPSMLPPKFFLFLRQLFLLFTFFFLTTRSWTQCVSILKTTAAFHKHDGIVVSEAIFFPPPFHTISLISACQWNNTCGGQKKERATDCFLN